MFIFYAAFYPEGKYEIAQNSFLMGGDSLSELLFDAELSE
jgi:hypothetical protein